MMKTLASARPALSAETLAELIREAGVPCVTVVADEAAATAIPATPRDEGLRIVAGSMPVRVAYPIPARGGDEGPFWAALTRHDDHVLWLYEFVEQYRWSASRDGPHADPWITISPEPRPATYTDDRGRECSRATGLPMDGYLARWVVLQTIEDADAFADWIVRDVQADIAAAGKLRASREYLGQFRIRDAEQIRAAGPRASCDGDYYHDDAQAQAETRAKGLTRLGHPGVRYEAAPVTGYASCRTCLRPVLEAAGQWWHRNGDCPGPRKIRDVPAEPGDWVINTGAGTMTCGYCGLTEHWLEADRSWVRLTGVHSLGVQLMVPETGYGTRGHIGDLVVLAEVEWVARWPVRRDVLPHYCAKIPDQVRAEYAGDIEPTRIMAALAGRPT
jgi:hypothetical protein